MQIPKLLFMAGLLLLVGFTLGQALAPSNPYPDRLQHYTEPQIPVGQFDEMVSVDVIRNGDDIWVVDHYSGRLIFECNRFKEADKEVWREYADLLKEM